MILLMILIKMISLKMILNCSYALIKTLFNACFYVL